METTARMVNQVDERSLLAACVEGDRDAFATLYDRHQRSVFSIAVNFFGGDRDRAADVAQAVFVKIFQRSDLFDGNSQFTTWLYRVTINACIDERRRTRRFFGLDEFFGLADASVRQDERIDKQMIAASVQTAIATLRPKYRIPMVLRYTDDLSYAEIAAILDVSVGTVSSRLNRGHTMLAKKLGHLRDKI